MHLTDTLTWHHHISNVISTCNRRFFVLRKLKSLTTPKELELVYSGLLRSIMEYACPAFVSLPKKLEDKIQRLDYRAYKLINSNEENSQTRFTPDRLKTKREVISKRIFIKVANDKSHTLHKYIPKRLLHSKHYTSKLTRTKKYKNTFFPYVTTIMNKQL